MPDYLTLLWVTSKMIELKRRSGNIILQLKESDYGQIDLVMGCSYGQSLRVLRQLSHNPYTDKWSKQQFNLLSKICREELAQGKGDWRTIAKKLKEKNNSIYKDYRCRIQCQVKYSGKNIGLLEWTQLKNEKFHQNNYTNKSQTNLSQRSNSEFNMQYQQLSTDEKREKTARFVGMNRREVSQNKIMDQCMVVLIFRVEEKLKLMESLIKSLRKRYDEEYEYLKPQNYPLASDFEILQLDAEEETSIFSCGQQEPGVLFFD